MEERISAMSAEFDQLRSNVTTLQGVIAKVQLAWADMQKKITELQASGDAPADIQLQAQALQGAIDNLNSLLPPGA
jgi:predicted  nucleic acid-binding Zn-ribbon protein